MKRNHAFVMKALLTTVALALALASTQAAPGRLNVVATTPDLGAIAEEIGGDRVKVTSLARATEDPHFVDARPSFIRLLNQADALIEGGAELEIGWLPPLVNNARNAKILADAPGRIVASRGVKMLDVPSGPIDRSQGDFHVAGNPHYTLDPANCGLVAATIAEAFAKLDPPSASAYESRRQRFQAKLDEKLAEWMKLMEPFRGAKVLTYHKTYDYLAARFGLVVAGQIEPKPGIEPSPTHINALVPRMKAEGVKLVMIEPNRSPKTPIYLARQIGAEVVVLPSLVGAHEKAQDIFGLFDYNLGQMAAALKKSK